MSEASFAVRGDLRSAESQLIGHSAMGTACNLSGELPERRRVRAAVVYALCTGGVWSVHAKGVHLVGAVIDGPLDFEHADLRVPLTLRSCDVGAGLRLRSATAPVVAAVHCHLGDRVDAALLHAGRLALTGSTTSGPVVVTGAIVERDLDLDGAHIAGTGPDGGALVGDGLRVGGGLFLGDGCRVAGAVRLTGAAVVGNVDMSGARLSAPGCALLADGLRVAGGVVLANGFEAGGAIRLAGATIEGQLSLAGARITAADEDGAALVGDGLRVGGDVFLRDGFEAAGSVHLAGAQVGGSLELDGARITPWADPEAVVGDGLVVRGDLLATDGFEAGGSVRLPGATVGGNVELAGGRVTAADEDGAALVGDRLRVGGGLFLGDGFAAAGTVRLVGAVVDGELALSGATVLTDGPAVVADGIRIGSDALFDRGFLATGTVRLEGALVGGNLRLDGAQLTPAEPGGDALVADNLYVRGDLSMRDGFGADGVVRLVGAYIAGRLTMAGATVRRAVLSGARCTELADEADSWPAEGELVLRGFRYEAIDGDAGWEHRLAWVRRQGFQAWSPDPYEQLALYYAAVGDEEAACRVRISKDDDELAHLKLTRRRASFAYRFWRRPFGWLVGYGYRRNRAGWLLVATLLVAGLVFRWAEADGAMVPDEPAVSPVSSVSPVSPDGAAVPCGVSHPCFSSLVYGADVVLPIVDFGQDGAWRPVESDTAGPAWVWARWAFTAVGWALASVFVAAFTGLVARTGPTS